MTRLERRSLRLARHGAQAGLDAAVTIAARAPGLALGAVQPFSEAGRENRLMVQEKIAAAYEGAIAAQFAWGAFLMKAAFGGVSTPAHVSHALVDVAAAAFEPARKAVRANARRLSGTKKLA